MFEYKIKIEKFSKIIKFNITFISNNKIKILKKSLQKIVQHNKHRLGHGYRE